MNMETWVVKKAGGEELGYIRKLIIDSKTRQLSYADVALTQTSQLVRLPWTELEVRHEGIFLKSAHVAFENAMNCPSHPAHPASRDVLEVPIRVPGKIGQSRQSLSPSRGALKCQR